MEWSELESINLLSLGVIRCSGVVRPVKPELRMTMLEEIQHRHLMVGQIYLPARTNVDECVRGDQTRTSTT